MRNFSFIAAMSFILSRIVAINYRFSHSTSATTSTNRLAPKTLLLKHPRPAAPRPFNFSKTYWTSTLFAQSPFFFMSTKATETCLPCCRSPSLALLPPEVIFVLLLTMKL